MGNLGQAVGAALLHRGKQAIEIPLGVLRPFCAPLQQLRKKAVRQQLHAVGEKAEHKLIDKVSEIFGRVATLQPKCDRGKLVGGFLCDGGTRFLRPQLLRIEEDRTKNIEVARLDKLVQRQLGGLRNRVGPRGTDHEAVRIARYLEWRILKRRCISDQLPERVIEIALFLLVFPGEEALLPDIREAVAAACLDHAFFESEPLADGVSRNGIVMPEQRAKVEEMRLRRSALGKRDGLPFRDELLRRHRTQGYQDSQLLETTALLFLFRRGASTGHRKCRCSEHVSRKRLR